MRCIPRGAAVLAGLVFLSACANLPPDRQVAVRQALMVACNVDGVLVPLAQPVVASLGSTGATASGIDSLLVHPAVVAACQIFGGVPSSVDPVPVPGDHARVPSP